MASILSLNQDCLNNIFEYLTIYELIDVEDVCAAFKTTCELAYESKRFHSFKMELRYLKTGYINRIFDRIGETIRSYSFSGGYIMDEAVKQQIIDAMSEDCLRLNKLTINYIQFRSKEQFMDLQKCFENLTYLDLSRCAINESLIGCLDGEQFKNIKTLKVAGNAQMSGEFFKDMRYVEVLDASYCFDMNYSMLQEFLKNCINLKELDISASHQVIPDDINIFEELFRYQPNLEKIVMNDVGIERDDKTLAKFKKLKYSSVTGRKFGL